MSSQAAALSPRDNKNVPEIKDDGAAYAALHIKMHMKMLRDATRLLLQRTNRAASKIAPPRRRPLHCKFFCSVAFWIIRLCTAESGPAAASWDQGVATDEKHNEIPTH